MSIAEGLRADLEAQSQRTTKLLQELDSLIERGRRLANEPELPAAPVEKKRT